MVNPVYSIRDSKGDFWAPRVFQNEPSAVRDLAMVANETGNVISFAPRDFELYYVGDFDSETGKLIPCEVLKFVVSAADLVGVLYEK